MRSKNIFSVSRLSRDKMVHTCELCGHIDCPQKLLPAPVHTPHCTVCYCVLTSFGILGLFIASVCDVHSLSQVLQFSVVNFSRVPLHSCNDVIEMCFFSIHFEKNESEIEEKWMLSCNFCFIHIECACSPNQNGNGRAELKNELYANVADSNGNESHEWLERWEREREKI